MEVKNITVLGAGSWGCTLSCLLSERKNLNITLWEFDPAQAKKLKESRKLWFFPELKLSKRIKITSNLKDSLANVDLIVIALPSHTIREVLKKVSKFNLKKSTLILSASKGLEEKTDLRISQIIAQELPFLSSNIAVISGPSHAEEVSKKIPTTVVIAAQKESIAKKIQSIFMRPYFRVYTNSDIIGIELAGSLKNIIAIASGICDGLGLGDNTKAALATRGIAEIRRLGVILGSNPNTFFGLAGFGDIMVTCMSKHSRNRLLGEKIGQGKTLKTALKEMTMVAEGVRTTKAAYQLSQKHNVSLPITSEVYKILFKRKNPQKAVLSLMTRPPKSEKEDL